METVEILSTVDRVDWNEARKGVPFIISALRLIIFVAAKYKFLLINSGKTSMTSSTSC